MDKLRRRKNCVTDLFHYLLYLFVVSWTIGFIRKFCVDDGKKKKKKKKGVTFFGEYKIEMMMI